MAGNLSYKKKHEELTRVFRRKSELLRLLSEVVRTANSLLEPDALIQYIMDRIQILVKPEAWSLLMLDESGRELTFKKALGSKAEGLSDVRLKLGEGIAGRVAETGQPMIVNNATKSKYFKPELDRLTGFSSRNILCVPLRSRGKNLGVLELINQSEDKVFTEEDLETTLLFAEQVAVSLENAYLFQRIKQLSMVDDLTKLYNSRFLRQSLKVEIARAGRYVYPLAVIFLDLDGFKQVNDRYGHLVGSSTLKVVGNILKEGVRQVDIVSRYGGDEFTMILPNTDADGALLVAKRLLKAIVKHDYATTPGYDFELSASFGISCFPDHGGSPDELIQKADQAMYMVKETTKNNCRIFS